MRNSVFLLLGLLMAFSSQAQVMFQRVYGGESYDVGYEVIQTPDDGYLIAGTTGSFGFDNGQIMLIKTDFDGYEEWRRYYGNEFADQARSMELSADGHLLIAGFTETIENSYQVYAIKLTVDGDTIWTRNYGGVEWDFCRQAVALPDSGFALFGQSFRDGSTEGDYYLVRIDKNGNELWNKTYGGAGMESGESIALASDGGFYLAGYTDSFGAGKVDMYVVRTDANGDTLWTKTFGGAEDDFCYGVAVTPDGGYVIAGGSYSFTAGKADFVIYKDEGSMQWVRQSSYLGNDFWHDIIVEPIGNITVAGYFSSGGFGLDDARIVRYGADGIFNGMASGHGSSKSDKAYDVKMTSDGGYVMVGVTQGFLERFDDVYLIKLDNIGNTVPSELGVDQIDLNGVGFSVKVYPNPFQHIATLNLENFELIRSKVDGPMEVQVMNAVGEMIYTTEVNTSNTELDLSRFTQGVYFYLLKTRTALLATGKLVKLN